MLRRSPVWYRHLPAAFERVLQILSCQHSRHTLLGFFGKFDEIR
jgi:hypothetical protein